MVLSAIAEAATIGNRYPDLAVTGLTARLADEFGMEPERIAVGCGSVSLCQQLVSIACAGPADEVVYAWRSFESYPIVTQVAGARRRIVPLDAEFRHDLDAMAAAVTPDTRLVSSAARTTPPGRAVRRAEFERFLRAVGPNVLVALDEAYREFVTDPGRGRRNDPARRPPEPGGAAHLLQGLPAGRAAGGVRAGDAGGGAGAAKGRVAVRREHDGPSGGARGPGLSRRAVGCAPR